MTQQEKPTPTQAEMDRHARGERLRTHEYDGSPIEHIATAPGPAPVVSEKAATEKAAEPEQEKAMSAEHSKTYKTRRTKSDEE
jgi:hypothetical protein